MMSEHEEDESKVGAEELARSLEAMPAWEVDDVVEPPVAEPVTEVEPEPVVPEKPEPVVDLSSPKEEASPPPLIRIVEGMLFVGDAPLSESRACGTIRGLTPEEFHRVIDDLNRRYHSQGRPYLIRKRQQGYELVLRRSFTHLHEKMRGGPREAKLSPAAVDVLALVAWKQPVLREDIESLRGAESMGPLRQLVRHGLIAVQRVKGDRDAHYVTTPRFLETFQLSSLDDLPRTQELQQL